MQEIIKKEILDNPEPVNTQKKESNGWLDRVKTEYSELMDKFKKLEAFIDSEKFRDTVKDDYSAFLLTTQKAVMERYLQILECRMGLEEPTYDGCEEIQGMSFGIALLALKAGFPVKRKGWDNKNECVIKQIPAHICSDVIFMMRSLPQQAKDMILDGKEFIEYKHQFILYDRETGQANNYIPSIADIFSHDWEVIH